jgi:hypothetical protein
MEFRFYGVDEAHGGYGADAELSLR